MKRRSNKFQPGQRLAGTMLTVVDSLNPLSWDDVIVDCDCGNRVTIPYMAAYRRQFSCGCKSRLRQNAPDATGQRYFNKAGNVIESPNDGRPIAHGRGLTIVMRDPETQRWIYLCECCAETFVMPGGQDRTPEAMLKKLAGETCPNFRPRYEVSDDKWHSDLEVVVMRVLPRHYDRDPESLVPYYTNPRHVVRDKYGTVIAFLGLPDSLEFKAAVETRIEKYKNIRRGDRAKKLERKQKMEALFYGEVVPERPATPPPATAPDAPVVPEIIEDDFADAHYAGYVPYTPPE